MALDGLFLHCLQQEISDLVLQARVDKIHQPSREELIITLRYRGGSAKLLLSASAGSPRVHFTKIPLENPKSPPMFCMLLRKHLSTAKLVGIRQHGLDRVLFLDFETVSELGDLVVITIAVEIMGRHSNIIVIGPDGKILDAIKRVNDEMSSVRPILPGMIYTLPPKQDKLSLFEATADEAQARFATLRNMDFAKAILSVYEGFSPLVSRELALTATGGLELKLDEVSNYRRNRLFEQIDALSKQLQQGGQYQILLEQDRPVDFSFLPIEQYGSLYQAQSFDSPSMLLDSFYAERDRIGRMKQRSHDLLKLLVNASDRTQRKLTLQQEELAQSVDREPLRMQGDLLQANLWQMTKGDHSVTVQNFFQDNYPDITILLNPALTPAQNAQRFYTDYRKAKTAEEKLLKLIVDGKQELIYLDSIFDALTRSSGESELLEIRQELVEQGYLKSYKHKSKMLKPQPSIKFRSSDGFLILCGRNNKQNDLLTLKTAHNYDLWLHTQSIAGSHVIVVCDGKEIPNRTIEEAAIIAAYHSHGRESTQVPVDYTLIRHVKKPNGAKPGMVIFDHYQTAFVAPNQSLVQSLLLP